MNEQPKISAVARLSDRSQKILDYCKQHGQITVGGFLPTATAIGIVAPSTGQPYKSPRALGSGISASWREVERKLGDAEADHISTTFIDPVTGELVWKKYHA